MNYHHRDHDVEKAIERALDKIVEQVLWHLDEGEVFTRERVEELISEARCYEEAAVGLDFEQKLQAIERGVDISGVGDLSVALGDLRGQIDSHAVQAIHWLAEDGTARRFESLFDFMDEHDLDPSQLRSKNPLAWLDHATEREVEGAVVYEYRNVEEKGNHVDSWKVSLADGWSVWLEVPTETA